jgi:hypothetical protein
MGLAAVGPFNLGGIAAHARFESVNRLRTATGGRPCRVAAERASSLNGWAESTRAPCSYCADWDLLRESGITLGIVKFAQGMTVKSIIAKLERQQRDLKETIAAPRYLGAFGPHKAHHEIHSMTSRKRLVSTEARWWPANRSRSAYNG